MLKRLLLILVTVFVFLGAYRGLTQERDGNGLFSSLRRLFAGGTQEPDADRRVDEDGIVEDDGADEIDRTDEEFAPAGPRLDPDRNTNEDSSAAEDDANSDEDFPGDFDNQPDMMW
jgi:hypothetical protein